MRILSGEKRFVGLAVAGTLAVLFALPDHSSRSQTPGASAAPKYVFLFLSDGGGVVHLEIARQYSRHVLNESFNIVDKVLKEGSLGMITTHAADSLSTDSAAAATALARGCKANIGALGVCADGTSPASAMEIARRQGMRLGLVTNAAVYDASPAAFFCNLPNRRNFAEILNRYLESAPDVLLG
ncbi:MAG: alkaline phosphatase, partial [Candidatus Binatia bacterium]